jgi:hypothetical protein
VQPFAPQAPLAAGQTPTLALAGGAIATGPAGHAVTPGARPQAQFTSLLESLVDAGEAGDAPAAKKDAPAVNKEDPPRVAFWMAAPTAAPQVSHPAKPADGSAETQDGAHTDDSLTAEAATMPETSGDAAAAAVPVVSQSGAPLPRAVSIPIGPWPEAPEDRAELPQAAAPAMENGAPHSRLFAKAAEREQETAGGTAASAEAKSRQTAGDRRAADGTRDRNQAAAEQETTGSLASGENTPDDHRSPALAAPMRAGPRGLPGNSQRVRDLARAGTEVNLPQTASARCGAAPEARPADTERQGAASQQETPAGNSDGLMPAASMVQSPTQLAALPAAGQASARPALKADRTARPWREARSAAPGATGKDAKTNAGTLAGQPLAAPAVEEPTAAVSQSDSSTAQNGGALETAVAAGLPAANSAPAALELPDDAVQSRAARPMAVAFTARLRPMEAAPEAPGGELPNRVAEPIERAAAPDLAAATGEMGRGERENSQNAWAASTRQPDGLREPVRKPGVSAAGAPESAVTARPATAAQPLAATDARPRESAPDSPPAAAAEPASAPEAPKLAVAHDIKLELAGQGDRRVEVRVSERAGDMHVEVRTLDTGLAGDLREELPALATKLEQAGFRAETWHPAGTAERQRSAEAALGAASQNSDRQPGEGGGQRQQRDPQQQPKPKAQENQLPSRNRGKDFAWLFSSIS